MADVSRNHLRTKLSEEQAKRLAALEKKKQLVPWDLGELRLFTIQGSREEAERAFAVLRRGAGVTDASKAPRDARR